MPSLTNRKFLVPFILVTSLFFFWGFVHNLDPVLIPHLRRSFSLTNLEATLVDSSIFVAYFIMAIPAGLIMKKYGYKKGIITGLAFFAIGCFLFVPAADTMKYVYFLGALFVVACGLAILETAANPYATILGDPETATQRLNFAQSFNGLAAFLAPVIGTKFISSKDPLSDAQMAAMTPDARTAYLLSETASVKMPYVVLGCVILVVALIFLFTKLPDRKDADEVQKDGFFHVFKYIHVRWAVAAQFFYVGAQVCVFSLMILFAQRVLQIPDDKASWYAGTAGLLFLIGRFAGTFLMRFIKPARLLTIYATLCLLLSLIVIFGSGMITIYSLLAIAFFCSIMFPTIFALGIENLGADSKPASSLVIMSIVGGALIPPVLGIIADKTGNFQLGYIVLVVCFAVVMYFGLRGHKPKVV